MSERKISRPWEILSNEGTKEISKQQLDEILMPWLKQVLEYFCPNFERKYIPEILSHVCKLFENYMETYKNLIPTDEAQTLGLACLYVVCLQQKFDKQICEKYTINISNWIYFCDGGCNSDVFDAYIIDLISFQNDIQRREILHNVLTENAKFPKDLANFADFSWRKKSHKNKKRKSKRKSR